jgi:hypothetical protein
MRRVDFILVTCIFLPAFFIQCRPVSTHSKTEISEEDFFFTDLKTDTSIASIDLNLVFDGGPGKNGIPAIDFPLFTPVEEAAKILSNEDWGILVEFGGEQKFYPVSILNWHEVVNDVVGGRPVAVTFCPLCGSAMVFNRYVGKDTLQFGVSGTLYESNLLMFDEQTESLWSQAAMQAVAGYYTGTILELLPAQFLTFEQVMKSFSRASVLSFETGYERNYFQNPYGEYLNSRDLFFPVSLQDTSIHPKEMYLAFEWEKIRYAVNWNQLLNIGNLQVGEGNKKIEIALNDLLPSVISPLGDTVPAYFTMWFSWYSLAGKRDVAWHGPG